MRRWPQHRVIGGARIGRVRAENRLRLVAAQFDAAGRGAATQGRRRHVEVERQILRLRVVLAHVTGCPIDVFELELDRGTGPHGEQFLAVDEPVHLVHADAEVPRGFFEGE
jgi:hypothetical protein